MQSIAVQSKYQYVKWHTSTATFTGISSSTEFSCGHVTIPIGLPGIPWATYGADVIGGQSSFCPGLLPLRTLSRMHCVLCCGWHPNGDGVLAVWHSHTWKPQHLHLTDSGHYMLRVDGFGKKAIPSSVVTETISNIEHVAPQKKTRTAEFRAESAAHLADAGVDFR